MTTVYFIRHAQSDNSVRDGRIRPLTEKGHQDRRLVTDFLDDKHVDIVLSSPFKRAVDTIADFTEKHGFEVETMENFRERKSDSDMDKDNTDFSSFMKRQWSDFNYTFSDGECLAEVQERNLAALSEVLAKHKGKNIVIGTHGTALSTIINYYDRTYGYDDFMQMVNIMPWVVQMDFNGKDCVGMKKMDLFNPDRKPDYSQCKVFISDIGALKAYRFVVVLARYQDKWVYCRAKERDIFETAGGHIELGETTLEAAKRELYEETGATKYDITPVFDYSAHIPTEYSNGQVFFAQIYEFGDIPDFEMAEVKLFDTIPDRMRFPKILPVIYDEMQKKLDKIRQSPHQ